MPDPEPVTPPAAEPAAEASKRPLTLAEQIMQALEDPALKPFVGRKASEQLPASSSQLPVASSQQIPLATDNRQPATAPENRQPTTDNPPPPQPGSLDDIVQNWRQRTGGSGAFHRLPPGQKVTLPTLHTPPAQGGALPATWAPVGLKPLGREQVRGDSSYPAPNLPREGDTAALAGVMQLRLAQQPAGGLRGGPKGWPS